MSFSQGREISVLHNSVCTAAVVLFIFGVKAVLDESGVRMAMAVIGEACILGAFWAMQKGRITMALNLFFLMSWQAFMGANLTYGGADSLMMAWWVIFLCLAGLLGGQRYTIVWGLVAFSSMLLLWGLNAWAPMVSALVVEENKVVQVRMHLIAQLAVSIVIVQSFVTGSRRYEDKILSYTHELESEVEKRRVAESEAVSSQKSTVQFFANMSHELRTPLNCIIGFSRRLLKRNSCPDDQDSLALQRIHSNAQGLSNLVSEMFYLSGLSAARFEFSSNAFALESLVQDCVTAAESLAHKYDLSICFDCEERVLIQADRLCLHQAIINLLYFSIRQTKAGGITVTQKSVMCGGVTRACLEVSDTSAGIPDEQLAHLFETHYKFVLDSNKDLPISALAIVISAKLIELHRGNITVESELDKGTIFTVILPLKREGCE